jgi:beta-glucosidase
LQPSAGSGPGLLTTYWNNADFDGSPALSQVEPMVDLAGPPAGVGPVWSARWTGTLTPPSSGLYRFSLLTAGLVHARIGDQVVGSAYREATQFLGGPQYPVQLTVRLAAGRPVPVEIDYSSKAQLFGAQIHLSWQPPSASLIPAAVEVARHSDVAIVFANDAQGEGMDRTTLVLPGDQDALIEAVAAANHRTVVVLNTGGPVLMPWLDRVSAVLETWYPGQQFGTALAAVLFGDADAGGRLPVTFPASNEQGPAPPSRPERYPGVNGNEQYTEGLDVGYRWYEAVHQQPLFPFGFGLSYSRFRFSDLSVQVDQRSHSLHASVQVTNTGERHGSTVAQLYLAFPPAAHEPPRQLKGYARVTLEPGQRQRVRFDVDWSELAVFDTAAQQFVVARGRYVALVGSSSRDLPEQRTFDIDR